MKYVMFKRGDELIPVMFGNEVSHREVATALKCQMTLCRAEVVSAGFCDLKCTETYGNSDTLGIDAVWEDKDVISRS